MRLLDHIEGNFTNAVFPYIWYRFCIVSELPASVSECYDWPAEFAVDLGKVIRRQCYKLRMDVIVHYFRNFRYMVSSKGNFEDLLCTIFEEFRNPGRSVFYNFILLSAIVSEGGFYCYRRGRHDIFECTTSVWISMYEKYLKDDIIVAGGCDGLIRYIYDNNLVPVESPIPANIFSQ